MNGTTKVECKAMNSHLPRSLCGWKLIIEFKIPFGPEVDNLVISEQSAIFNSENER